MLRTTTYALRRTPDEYERLRLQARAWEEATGRLLLRYEGNTVAELVANMTGQGLRFAPAASGDEPSYTALHRAMVTYVFRLKQAAGE